MKKAISVILIIGILCGLYACSPTPKINNVTLSTNTCEIVQEETYKLSYVVLPEDASTDVLVWKSADENVATVEQDGTIHAKAAGQTTITVSYGTQVFSSCSVTVLEKSAYLQLNDEEKTFVDAFLTHINDFKNPSSVEIRNVFFVAATDTTTDFWEVEVSAQNGFGGFTNDTYYLHADTGFSKSIIPTYASSGYNIDLINKAIKEALEN